MRYFFTFVLLFFCSIVSAVEIVDGKGARFSFSKPPKTASLAPVVSDLIFALGAEDNLVAVSAFCDTRRKDIARIGTIFGVDWERVVKLSPELAIVSHTQDSAVAERLKACGIKCVSLHKESLSGIVDDIVMLGQIFDCQKRAKELADKFRLQLDNPYEGEKVRALFLFSDVAAGKGAFVADMLNLCGFENCADDIGVPWPILSREFILEKNPQVVFIASLDTTENARVLARLRSDSAWHSTDAVKNLKVFFVPLNDVILPSVRVLNAIEFFRKTRKEFQ